jgi:hypothetical protein
LAETAFGKERLGHGAAVAADRTSEAVEQADYQELDA